MREGRPGEEIAYTVTWLEMAARPGFPWPAPPPGDPLLLIRAEDPPAWYFRALYGAVGGAYEWTDWNSRPDAEVAAFIGHGEVRFFTLLRRGWPAGFFILDWREPPVCNLAYFGLVPEAVGRGLGRWLLETAVLTGWERAGTARMTVNTNTLDHPAALALYQRVGFVPVARTEHRRTLTRPRAIPD